MKKLKLNAQSALPLVLLAVYSLLILTRLIPSEVMDSTVKLFFALIILELLVFALPVYLYSRMRERDYLKELPFHFFPGKFTPFLVSLGFLMLSGGLVINALFYFWGFGSASYASLGSFILSDVSIDKNPLYVLLAYGALPAVCEEVLFRGILIHEYKKYSFPTAAIISSLAYAFCYFDLSSFPFYFLSGLILAYIVRMTGSLFAAILTRFALNVASIYLMPSIWGLLTQPLGVLFAVFVAMALFIICLFFALKTAEKRYREMACDPLLAEERPYPFKKAVRNALQVLKTPAYLLCIATYVVTVVLTLLLE